MKRGPAKPVVALMSILIAITQIRCARKEIPASTACALAVVHLASNRAVMFFMTTA